MWRHLVVMIILQTDLPIACVQADDHRTVSELIDRRVQSRLDAEGIERAPLADDATFLRRAFLDLHGVIPTSEEAAQFLESVDSDKRSQLIEELLSSPRFGEHFSDVWRGYLISPLANEQRTQTERF